MLELQCVAVQINRMVFLSLRRSKLVHHTAHNACVLMLASLTNQSQLRAIFLIIVVAAWISASVADRHFFRKGTCGHNFHRRTTAQTRTGRHVSKIQQVIAAL